MTGARLALSAMLQMLSICTPQVCVHLCSSQARVRAPAGDQSVWDMWGPLDKGGHLDTARRVAEHQQGNTLR